MTPPTHDHAPTRQPGSVSASSRALRAVRSAVSKLAPGKGIYRDVVARAPWYASDWRDAWNYRVVPATALIFFANVLPGIAFSLDLIETTNQYGVSEVLLSSFMAAFIFSVFGAQPLCIAGVTGPITVLNKTIYDIMIKDRPNAPDYLQFVGWVYMWGAILHWITAILNACNFLRYVTLFSCDTFGFYVSWVYLEYGIQVITRQLSTTPPAGVLTALVLALIMLGTCLAFRVLSASALFHRHIRRVFADYGMPASLVAASACAYWGLLNRSDPPTLPISRAFEPANGRAWLVRFWELDAANVGIAFPFGLVLWILFFFDHNVSSLMAQAAHFPLRKPPGFHWDFFLLGCTTFVAGLLGVPAPNGLIPQAPIHTDSLVVRGVPARCRDAEAEGRVDKGVSGSTTAGSVTPGQPDQDEKREVDAEDAAGRWKEVPVGVVEQRVSNLAQGSLCLILLTGPFLHVLNLIPKGVLAGLFWYMALDALAANGITHKIRFLVADRTLLEPKDPLRRVRRSRIVLFVAVQLVGFGATFAVTQTIAAIGFPVIILFLLPLRTFVVPRLPFTADELAILDGPTASPFTMESVGGGAY